MTEDVCASHFRREEDVVRFEISIGDKSYIVKVLESIGRLSEDKAGDSLSH